MIRLLLVLIFIDQTNALAEMTLKEAPKKNEVTTSTEGRLLEIEKMETFSFSGYQWMIKSSKEPVGPGPNYFSTENVWIDQRGKLHLKVSRDSQNSQWKSSEVYSSKALGYGTYKVNLTLVNRKEWDDNLVFGAFTWDDKIDTLLINKNREIDFEISKWGNSKFEDMSYVIQPVEELDGMNKLSENFKRFRADYNTQQKICYSLIWEPTKVGFITSFLDEIKNTEIILNEYEYKGKLNPTPGNAKFHLNFWLYRGQSSLLSKFLEAEVIIDRFEQIPHIVFTHQREGQESTGTHSLLCQ